MKYISSLEEVIPEGICGRFCGNYFLSSWWKLLTEGTEEIEKPQLDTKSITKNFSYFVWDTYWLCFGISFSWVHIWTAHLDRSPALYTTAQKITVSSFFIAFSFTELLPIHTCKADLQKCRWDFYLPNEQTRRESGEENLSETTGGKKARFESSLNRFVVIYWDTQHIGRFNECNSYEGLA